MVCVKGGHMKLHQRNQIFVKSSLKVFVGFFWLVGWVGGVAFIGS